MTKWLNTNSALTIPIGIKLFSISVDFSQNQLLAMLKVLKICWTLFLSTCLKLGGVMCTAKIIWHVFPPPKL
jgi:hypothetical protein